MGVVTWMVETTDTFLDDTAQTTFGNVAGQLGGVIAVASTLAVIGVFLNMVFQYKSMDGRTAFWFALKLMLISMFSLNWVQCNAVASAIIDGLDQLAGGMVAGAQRRWGRRVLFRSGLRRPHRRIRRIPERGR